jgi:hypothetical protein
MAIGTDRVQLYKDENPTLGGNAADVVPGPSPIKPQQDAIETCGVFLQDASNRDEEVYLAREGVDMIFRDQHNTTPITLSQLNINFRRHFLLMGG